VTETYFPRATDAEVLLSLLDIEGQMADLIAAMRKVVEAPKAKVGWRDTWLRHAFNDLRSARESLEYAIEHAEEAS
jgi:hypothetical protein